MNRSRLVGAAFGVALAAASLAGCARRPSRATVVPTPEVRVEAADAADWQRLEETARWERSGRLVDAKQSYEDIAAASPHGAVVRTALLRAALIQLMLRDDLPEGQRMLRAARALYPAGDEPSALTVAMRLVERLIAAERTTAAAAREAAVRDDELRTLRRNAAALQQLLDKRDDALRKAAQAAVGGAPVR